MQRIYLLVRLNPNNLAMQGQKKGAENCRLITSFSHSVSRQTHGPFLPNAFGPDVQRAWEFASIKMGKMSEHEMTMAGEGTHTDTQAEAHVYMYTGPTWAREDENTLSIKFVRNELIFARVCVECDRRTEKKCLKKKHRYVTCIRTNVTMERYNFAHCYSIHTQCYCQLSKYRK